MFLRTLSKILRKLYYLTQPESQKPILLKQILIDLWDTYSAEIISQTYSVCSHHKVFWYYNI